ncbi:hypothetical protein STANM309S_05976 [Streptomyces tanashiensis]
MLPCAILRRRACGDMSTSSIWSARRTTSSGTVSRCRTPVMASTTSPRDSRCWMLTVETTSIPAARSSATSCHRLGFREPGTFVWASSSTRATAGRRARTASMSISVKVVPRYSRVRRGICSRPCSMTSVRGRPWCSTNATTQSVPRSTRRWPSESIA